MAHQVMMRSDPDADKVVDGLLSAREQQAQDDEVEDGDDGGGGGGKKRKKTNTGGTDQVSLGCLCLIDTAIKCH